MRLLALLKKYYGYLTLAAFALLCLSWPLLANGMLLMHRPDFPHAELVIQRSDGQKINFHIEVASTPEQEEYGLMFVRSLPADAGMLFMVEPDRFMAMWMKNTYIPLDMLFVRHNGTIVKIITHAKPFDLTLLGSDEDVHGVIEINGGVVEAKGLRIGDKVLFPGFGATP
jgi:uncharacterized membrane protein (UPF0127 family)